MMRWHTTPLAQQLIADMFSLSDIYDRHITLARAAGERWPNQDETAHQTGTLERHGGFGKPYTWEVSGLVAKVAGRLDGERDRWIEDEVFRVADRRGMSRAANLSEAEAEAWDDLWDEVRAATDTMDDAINAWVRGHQKGVA